MHTTNALNAGPRCVSPAKKENFQLLVLNAATSSTSETGFKHVTSQRMDFMLKKTGGFESRLFCILFDEIGSHLGFRFWPGDRILAIFNQFQHPRHIFAQNAHGLVSLPVLF